MTFHVQLTTCPRATIVDVMLVPMFAPIIIGIACFMDNVFAPHIVTMILVEVLEDCNKTVTSTPKIKPAIGLFRITLSFNTVEA